MRKILVVVLFMGCGDPRAVFVGHYVGTYTRTFSSNAQSDETTLTLTAPEHSDRLQFGGSCMLTAKVETADTFQVDPVVCPVQHTSSVGGVMADFTDSYSSGTGKLTNKTLSVTLNGSQLGSNYADGTPNQKFSFRDEIVATSR